MRFFDLPNEIIQVIFEYDNTYRVIYDCVLLDILKFFSYRKIISEKYRNILYISHRIYNSYNDDITIIDKLVICNRNIGRLESKIQHEYIYIDKYAILLIKLYNTWEKQLNDLYNSISTNKKRCLIL
jgi:hypothetical protein